MSPERIHESLSAVQASSTFVVARLDEGGPLLSRVAVMPASFNPPTLAHAELLRLALTVPGVRTAACLLTTRNVDKAPSGATYEQRAGMLLADPAAYPVVLVSNAARIVDLAEALRAAFPELDFDFVVGYDTLVRVFDEAYYDEMHHELAPFFAHHRLIAANRAEANSATVAAYLREHPAAAAFSHRVVQVALGDEHSLISSTAARSRLAAGAEPGSLLGGVARYIADHGLYRKGTPKAAS